MLHADHVVYYFHRLIFHYRPAFSAGHSPAPREELHGAAVDFGQTLNWGASVWRKYGTFSKN
jgi:hypothetical protein